MLTRPSRRPNSSARFTASDLYASLSAATRSMTAIDGRGAFSSTWRQKPYSVEVWDETAAERDVEILGMTHFVKTFQDLLFETIFVGCLHQFVFY